MIIVMIMIIKTDNNFIMLYMYQVITFIYTGFPGGTDGKEPACNAGDLGSIPRLARSSREGNGTSFQYSCLENPIDRGAWWATVHGVAELDMTE